MSTGLQDINERQELQTFSSQSEETSEDFIRAGEELWRSYCSSSLWSRTQPAMFPPAPNQKFVDKYSEKDLKTNRKATFDSKRKDYDAECAVFRALESLDHELLVLHSFSYTEKQNGCFDNEPDKAKEGEHDFVVIIPNSAVIVIEVKNPKLSETTFQNASKSARDQFEQFERLLKGISAKCNEKMLPCLKFCAFPHSDRADVIAMTSSETTGCARSFLCKDDFNDFSQWWMENARSHPHRGSVKLKQQSILLGLWLKGPKGMITSETNIWSIFGGTICRINSQLTNQQIYCKADKRPENIVKMGSPLEHYKPIFNDHLNGIKLITKEQKGLLTASHVFVNGPAGSGKTLIMRAKILRQLEEVQLKKDQEQQILVLLPWDDAAEVLTKLVNNFDSTVTIKKFDFVADFREQINSSFSVIEKLKKCTEKLIIIVRSDFIHDWYIAKTIDTQTLYRLNNDFLEILKSKNWHIFCDDFHKNISEYCYHLNTVNIIKQESPSTSGDHHSTSTTVHAMLELLKSADTSKTVWIGCDVMQIVQYGLWGTTDLFKEMYNLISGLDENCYCSWFSLSANLRNTYNIAQLLEVLRVKFLEYYKVTFCDSVSPKLNDFIKSVLPDQDYSHYIQGFTPRLYCVQGKYPEKKERIKDILKKELETVYHSLDAAQLDKNIAVIPVYDYCTFVKDRKKQGGGKDTYGAFRRDLKEMTAEAVPEGFNDCRLFTDNPKYANSLEFPAAILLVDLTDPAPELEVHSGSGTEDSPTADHKWSTEDDRALVNILSHLYLGISRARVWCSIIIVCSNDKPSPLYSKILEILNGFVRIIEV